jgi:hypothetical protein
MFLIGIPTTVEYLRVGQVKTAVSVTSSSSPFSTVNLAIAVLEMEEMTFDVHLKG